MEELEKHAGFLEPSIFQGIFQGQLVMLASQSISHRYSADKCRSEASPLFCVFEQLAGACLPNLM